MTAGKPDENEDRSAPEPALPSLADRTHTSQPSVAESTVPVNPSKARSVGPTHLRDPARYEIVGEHGRGGLGRVSRAHDHELGRDIAIKELITRGHVNEVRFVREALITARLEHPGIVPLYEAGLWPDGTPFYAMKLVSGRSLRELLAERATVDERIGLLHHVIAVADAIAYAHDRNIIHRDLKPANVIVGDFGETIVIDWGLAKDLTAHDESATGEGPFRTTAQSDLTSAGAVLGTPAYMAPEQGRGSRVDQRADVYAIGAMLWELCAPQKQPLDGADERRRMLRRAGIDQDLIAIIGKALDSDPDRRYRDAGALAADLKAFKSGVRIAAREYSLAAVLAHWTRRHRALALSIGAAAVLAATGSILYVRNIAIERDRADAAAGEARLQREQAERANAELTLQHAQLLLRNDPTAAFERLATYRGTDEAAVVLMRERARGLGVALSKASPHTGRVSFAYGLPGEELLTIGEQTVARTPITGPSRIIARNAMPQHRGAYARSRHLLAYACDPGRICLIDTASDRPRTVPDGLSSFAPEALTFSPDERHLAAIARDGSIAIWNIPDSGPPSIRDQAAADSGRYIAFADNETVVATTRTSVLVYQLAAGRSLELLRSIAAPGLTNVKTSTDGSRVAIATTAGAVRIVDLRAGSTVSSTALCRDAVNSVAFASGDTLLAYGCQDGAAGLWDSQHDTNTVIERVAGGVSVIATSEDARYLLIGGNEGNLIVHDANTEIVSRYLGHASRVTALQPPSPGFPFVASGDSSGALRIWPVPRASVRVAIRSKGRLFTGALLSNEGPLLAVGNSSALPWWSFDGTTGDLSGHAPGHMAMAMPRTEPRWAMFADDPMIELWSLGAPAPRVLKTDHGAVTAVRYLVDGASFVTAGRDGAIVMWSQDAQVHRELGRAPEAIENLAVQPGANVIIAKTARGLWRLDSGTLIPLAPQMAAFASYRFSSDGRWLATVSSEGDLRLYDTRTWAPRARLVVPSDANGLEFSATGEHLAIRFASSIYLVNIEHALRGGMLTDMPVGPVPWNRLDLSASSLEFSADGKWLGMTDNTGALWFYSFDRKKWTCDVVSTGRIISGSFSPDSRHFVAVDPAGRILLVDMASVLSGEGE